jgi:hypothetical protein
MAYYIFLKSLRSLEEFRKILMSKFLLNLLLQISKALVNSKIQFLIQKFFFLTFGLADLAAHPTFGPASPLASLPPQVKTAPAGPPSPRVGRVFTGIRFPFWFTPSELAASLCQVGSSCQFCLPPVPADHCRFLPSPPATPRRPTSDLEMPGEVFTPSLDSPP